MEKQTKTVNPLLAVITAVILAAAMAASLYFIITGIAAIKVTCAVLFLAMLCGLFYLVKGFRKDAAKFYRFYMSVSAFAVLVVLIAACVVGVTGVTNGGIGFILMVTVGIVLYGSFLLLGYAKDLGKKKNYIICAISCAISLISAAIIAIIENDAWDKASVIFATFVLSLLAFVMTVAKYQDKAQRGSN